MIRRLASIGATAAAVVTLAAAPAHADEEIGLSRDGITWTETLGAPLFDPGFRFVPGDVETRSFQVRNQGPSAGLLTVEVLAADPSALLVADDFTIEARVAGGPWVDVEAGTTPVRTELAVARNARTQVAVRATFDPDSTRQLQRVPFRVLLSLEEDGSVGGIDQGGDGSDGDDGDDGSVGGVEDGGLPATGSAVAPGLFWLAAACIGGGVALVRRREREEVAPRA